MILEKRENGLWWFYDAFYTDSFTPYPFGCIIDRSANTFVLTKENRPSYPKSPLPVADVQIRVLPSTSLETYSTAELLENRLLALEFPPLVHGAVPSSGISEAPVDGELYGRKDADWEQITNVSAQNLQDVTDNGNTTSNSIVANGLYIDEVNGIGINGDGNACFVDSILVKKNLSDPQQLCQFKGTYLTKSDNYQLPSKSGFMSLEHNLLNQYAIIPTITSTAISVIGKGINTSGALLSKSWASISVLTKQNRIGFDTTSTAGTTSYLRQIGGYFSINQGFHYVVYFGGSTGFNLSGVRAYIGITYSNNTTGNVEQDTMINSIGICRLSSSNNWWLMHNDASGTATKVDTGFSANTVDTDLFKLEINTLDNTIVVLLTKIGTYDTFSQVLTADLPDGDLPLTQRVFVTNNANASQVVLDFCGSTLNV